MIRDIIVSIITTAICSGTFFILSKFYFGFKHFGGIRKTARLNKDCYKAGIVNIFPNRDAYVQHEDHGKSYDYISKANHSVLYVGYWLSTGTEIGDITNTIKKLVKKQITVTLVFISPSDKQSLDICSNYIATKPNQIATRVTTVIKNLLDFRKELDSEQQKYLVIKTHNIPISTTAFIIDHSKSKECKILLDYKIFKGTRDSSYGIEFNNGNKHVTSKLLASYLAISKEATEINCVEDLHKHN